MKKNDKYNDDLVFCVQCPKNGRIGENRTREPKDKIEQTQWDSWVCGKCREENKKITLELVDFIKARIAVTKTEDEDQSKFIFRELLQNADDVKSNILVLRFEEDALYVANDGRAFTTNPTSERLSDFDRISRVLGRHQADDKETVGHFGSGFQTVYAITNSPEIHSSQISGQMNPTIQEWNHQIKKRESPYLHKKQKGVLFRFPWRDDIKAKEEFNGRKVFEDFPKCNKEEQKRFFEDLISYIHQAILCCQHLSTIRIIWHANEELEGVQVTRDFKLRLEDEDSTEEHRFIGTVKQGFIEPDNMKDEWNKSFQIEKWKWKSVPHSYRYLIGSKNATNMLGRVYFGRKANGSVEITTAKNSLVKELKRGDFHLLLPLFDVSEVFPQAKGRAFLYSVIPLPRKSRNKFSFSAHFFPTENRKDVDVDSNEGKNRIWYHILMENIAILHRKLFPHFLEIVDKLEVDDNIKQIIVLNSIPADGLHEWMRPGRESDVSWAKQQTDITLWRLTSGHILLTDKQWIKPSEAYWATDEKQEAVLKILGEKTFTKEFQNHPHFKFLKNALVNREVNLQVFSSLWSKFENENKKENGFLVYNQELTTGKILDKSAVNTLIDYCILRDDAWRQTLDVQVVPGTDGALRQLRAYPLLPKSLMFMTDLLAESFNIHEDFKTEELENKRKEMGELSCDDIIGLVNNTVEENPTLYENMDDKQHRLISMVLSVLVQELDFALKDTIKDQRFIPYRIGDTVSVGTPNTRISYGKLELIQGTHAGEQYQFESIFGTQKLQVPGLTKELEGKIKFLDMLDLDDKIVLDVENRLSLEKLMHRPNIPVNFIRHFLSPLHKSLFVDSNLEDFLGVHDKKAILEQKKEFQKALKVYFDDEKSETNLKPSDMGKVPCLYDSNYEWHNAEEFAIDVYPELELVGYRSLHEELRQWSKDTLRALGVAESPQASKIVKVIRSLVQDKENHRTELTNILVWLLTSNFSMDFNQIKYINWIPVVEGGFRTPEEVLFQSKPNEKIVGDDFEGFLDISSCSAQIKQRASIREKETKLEERLEAIGIKTEPSLVDMLQVVKKRRSDNKGTPEKLFDVLNNRLLSVEQCYERDDDSYGYYLNGKWLDSKKIRIMDTKSVPKGLEDIVLVLPENNHSKYLLFDGAKRGLVPDDILQALQTNQDADESSTLKLWDELRRIVHLIETKHKDTYGNSRIYPIQNFRISPKEIIYFDKAKDSELFKGGTIGKSLISGGNFGDRHIEIMEKLGARKFSEFDENDIIALLESEKRINNVLGPEKVDLVLSLIKELVELNPQHLFSEMSLWPAEFGGKIVWRQPNNCYLKDSAIARFFENDIPFLCVKLDGEENKTLIEYARLHGCSNFSDKVRKSSCHLAACPTPNQGLTNILKEMGRALGIRFRSIQRKSSCFDWLKKIESKVCDELVADYFIEETTKSYKIETLVSMEKEDSKTIIFLQWGNIQMYDELTDVIVEECTKNGFPSKGSDFTELKFLVYKLLKNDPYSWSDLIEGYEVKDYEKSFGDSYNTFICGGEEGGRGYLETRQSFQNWYGCCQICKNQTPGSENGYDTLEQVKSLISMKGGRYRGVRDFYATDNCLFLCPRHQTLYERRLVKFAEFEDEEKIDEIIELLKKEIKKYREVQKNEPGKFVEWPCSVFEGELGERKVSSRRRIKSTWTEKEITFTVEHLTGFLKTMLSYLQKNKNGTK